MCVFVCIYGKEKNGERRVGWPQITRPDQLNTSTGTYRTERMDACYGDPKNKRTNQTTSAHEQRPTRHTRHNPNKQDGIV